MAPIILLALMIGLPIVIIFFLRANGAIVFLALCAGSVLTQFVSKDSSNIFNSFFPASNTVNYDIVQLALLYGPALLTALFMIGRVNGSKAVVNLIPAIATGVVGALLAVSLLPGGVQHNIVTTDLWESIEQYQAMIVSTGVLLSLLTLWFTKPKHDKKKHK